MSVVSCRLFVDSWYSIKYPFANLEGRIFFGMALFLVHVETASYLGC